MIVTAAIPARLNSTRFPEKLMQPLGKQSVILTTYEAAKATQLFDQVWVITDSLVIYNHLSTHHAQVILDETTYETGSDRIAAQAHQLGGDIIINIQGDEPFINHTQIQLLIQALHQEPLADVATLKYKLTDKTAINNPNQVKIVCTPDNWALYFSRAPIPYNRDNINQVTYYKHIGIYAFRKDALIRFKTLPKTMNEQAESLENLRMLDHHYRIKVVETNDLTIGIDTPEDLKKANQLWTSITS